VLYFEGSVSGLNVGAPVVFRGVPFGRVTHISLVADDKGDLVTIRVGIDIFEESIKRLGAAHPGVTKADRHKLILSMIEHGLRARIAIASFVTGQARIELDLLPETPARYRATKPRNEIPTLPSPLEEFSRAFARIEVDKIANSLFQALESFNSVMAGEELRGALIGIRQALESFNSVMAGGELRGALIGIRQALESFNSVMAGEELQGTLIGIRQFTDDGSVSAREMTALLKNVQKTLQGFERAVDHDIRVALDSFAKAAERAEKFFLDADRLVSPNSAMVRDLQSAMKELDEAAKAIRNLARSLERNPESLLRGRGR